MLIQPGINAKEKGEIWSEAISTATNLDNIIVRPDRTKRPFTLFYNKDAKYMKHLKFFGEMAVVAIHGGKKMTSKLDNRGEPCTFVGYEDDHSREVYIFLNVNPKRTIMSRDARWLNIMWKHYKKKNNYAKRQVELLLDEEGRLSLEGNELVENRIECDGNNTPTQRKLGLDIGIVGAREDLLGRTRSQTQEMSSHKNESMERADFTMEDWIQ